MHAEPPGTYPPTPLNLHEMTGNVSEWVNDWYQWNYYQASTELNPQGPQTGKNKVLRGFSIVGDAGLKIIYERMSRKIDYNSGTGIRCALNSPAPVTSNNQ